MFKYEILNTGSDGNCIIINDIIALDMGISFKKIEPYLNKIKLIFISHEHQDHMRLSTLIKIHKLRPTIRFSVGFWLKDKLLGVGIKNSNIDVLKQNMIYNYKLFKIIPFILFHDVKNFGIKIIDTKSNERLLYAVDTNRIDHIKAYNYDLYLIEANYDENKIEQNIIKDRACGHFSYGERAKRTHLSIQKASEFLLKNIGKNSKYQFIHASKRNI